MTMTVSSLQLLGAAEGFNFINTKKLYIKELSAVGVFFGPFQDL